MMRSSTLLPILLTLLPNIHAFLHTNNALSKHTSTKYKISTRNSNKKQSRNTKHMTKGVSRRRNSATSFLKSQTADVHEKRCVSQNEFNLTAALWCAGLAFDAYTEPNEGRWERGSKGLDVAFISPAFTRALYKGVVEVQINRIRDLPGEEDTAQKIMTGGAVDAFTLVSVVEGKMKKDIEHLREKHSSGVIGLRSCTHVGRTSTAWGNINENLGKANYRKNQNLPPDKHKPSAYTVPPTWTKGGEAVFLGDKPMYIYVSEPSTAQLVVSVLDEDVVGDDEVIGSTFIALNKLIPNLNHTQLLEKAKLKVLENMKSNDLDELDSLDINQIVRNAVIQTWEGDLKLTSKPRKKDKGGQVTAGVVAGVMIAGPPGAALGALVGNLYEDQPRGVVEAKVSYIPIMDNASRNRYEMQSATDGVDWSGLYRKHIEKLKGAYPEIDPDIAGDDLEFCTYVLNGETGCSCGIYRSLEKKLIAVSFRGTTVPIDLLTDASIIQTPWIEGTEVKNKKEENIPMVHVGFRKSLESTSRRLKELILAAVAPEENIVDYDIIVTGHSLGGALATLFTTDIAEYGLDAGRGLPSLEKGKPWWERVVANMSGKDEDAMKESVAPPRPKSLRLYSFGSPRVGNDNFVKLFDSLVGKYINEAYRIVNDSDVVARLPRTVNGLVLGSIGYDHCGPTALIAAPSDKADTASDKNSSPAVLWIEGVSDDKTCPVRDGTPLSSPLAADTLLGDIASVVKTASPTNSIDWGSITGRLQKLTASDITSVFGIDKKYADREIKLIQSVASGDAITHHLEDAYFSGMARASSIDIVYDTASTVEV